MVCEDCSSNSFIHGRFKLMDEEKVIRGPGSCERYVANSGSIQVGGLWELRIPYIIRDRRARLIYNGVRIAP